MPSQSTERGKISTSGCHFWRPGRQRCHCLRSLLAIGERCSCMVQSLTYLCGKRQHVWRIKWRLESRHLVENTSRGPNVCFLAVRLALDNFRTETNDEIYTLKGDVKRKKKALIWVSLHLAQKYYWIEDMHHFPTGDETAILRRHPSREKVYSFAGQRQYLRVAVIFTTPSIDLVPGIKPASSHSAVRRSTHWANPATVNKKIKNYINNSLTRNTI